MGNLWYSEKLLDEVRTELLEREDQYITFRDLVERFDEVEKEFSKEPWNLLQIYNNFNILVGEEKIDSLDEEREKVVSQETDTPQFQELPWKELKECQEACQEALSALNRIRGIDENTKILHAKSDTTSG